MDADRRTGEPAVRRRVRLFATDPATGDSYHYLGVENLWSRAGGPGAAFAVTDGAPYGASGAGVFAWTGTRSDWTRIGGPATTITGGP